MVKKICFVCPRAYGYFNPEYGYTGGGAERQIHLISTKLTKQFDVQVIVGNYGQQKQETIDGVTLRRAYPLQPRQSLFQPFRHFSILFRAMKQAEADVYIHRGGPRNAAFVYLITRSLRKKWVYNIANDANIVERPKELSSPICLLFLRSILDSDAIISQTTYQKSLVKETYNRETFVVPNGYPTTETSPSFEERKYFLWVGSFDRDQKRPHLVLKLAKQLPNSSFRLVGPIDETNEYQNGIKKRSSQLDNVTLVGEVAPNEIHKEFSNAIALINTSGYEGFPNTFLEAWRQGTPVISLDVDPQRYLPLQFDCYAEGDIQTLSRLCEQFLENPNSWSSYATECKEKFESSLSIEQVAKKYSTVLSQL